MMRDELEMLKGQQVEVTFNGLIYKGRLVGASDSEIDLQTREQWISLPMHGVTSVKKAPAPPSFTAEEGSGEPSA